MNIDFLELKELFEISNEYFLKHNCYVIKSGVSERCLCGALMQELSYNIRNSKYKNYHVDVEYNRNEDKIKTIVNNNLEVIPITCDIIVHSRGENIEQHNLIAIEMKKSWASREEKNADKHRLIALTKDTFDDVWSYDGKALPEHVCRYIIGIYYEVNIKNRKVYTEFYSKGNLVDTSVSYF